MYPYVEIDHMIQQPKETCQTTCRGPKTLRRGGHANSSARIFKMQLRLLPTMVWPARYHARMQKKSLLGRPARERLPSAYIIAQLLTYQSGVGGP